MIAHHLQHIRVTEKVVARLRLAVVLLVGAQFLPSPPQMLGGRVIIAIWIAALTYALAVVLAEPYQRAPLIAWEVTSGFIDWGFITLGIIAAGGQRSELHLLYFLSVLSIAMRFALREVVLAGIGTALGYLGIVLGTGNPAAAAWEDASVRMAYLLIFSVGSGVLAREANRQFRARIREEARRLAVQEVTATVSHDLKTPLAAVTGLVEILLDSAAETLSLDQRALLHRINANTHQMNDLVSNLLDAELIERGHQSFRPAPVDLNGLVRCVVETQAHQAEEKQIGLVLDLSPRLPVAVVDGGMIERLVANLLSNAVKFTPESGAIRVSTRQRGGRVVIEVWNSGPDVPASVQSTLFEKFVRQEDSSGVGLGLYICKSIVDMHRGTIAQRAADDGVAFVAELPVANSPGVEVQRLKHATAVAHSHRRRTRRRVGALVEQQE